MKSLLSRLPIVDSLSPFVAIIVFLFNLTLSSLNSRSASILHSSSIFSGSSYSDSKCLISPITCNLVAGKLIEYVFETFDEYYCWFYSSSDVTG